MNTYRRIALQFLFIYAHNHIVCGYLTEMSRKSHVEEFEGASALFDAVASSPNDGFNHNWQVISFPSNSADLDNNIDSYYEEETKNAANCSVIYLDQCTSWNKCRQTCQKTGASSYRWFHDGCCECVGSNCTNYGINESRCKHCPEPELESEDDEDDSL